MTPSVERVAEGLWQTVTGVDDKPISAHTEWLALPDYEKKPWRERAKVAIADWLKSMGQQA